MGFCATDVSAVAAPAWEGVAFNGAASSSGPPMRTGTFNCLSGTSAATASCGSRSSGQPPPWCWATSPGHALRHREDLQRQVVFLGELALRQRHAQQEDFLGQEIAVADDTDQPQFVVLATAEGLRPAVALPESLDSGLPDFAELTTMVHDVVGIFMFYFPVVWMKSFSPVWPRPF